MRRSAIALTILLGCSRSSPPTATADPKAAPLEPKSAPLPSASAAPSTSVAPPLPPFEDACKVDLDCVVMTDDIVGPNVCCSGCTQTVTSVVWMKAARAACAAHPPKMCPPIGCAMPLVTARCKSGRCVAAP
jgi:hypothetical protein